MHDERDIVEKVEDHYDHGIRLAIAELRHIRLRDKLDQARMDAAICRLESLL